MTLMGSYGIKQEGYIHYTFFQPNTPTPPHSLSGNYGFELFLVSSTFSFPSSSNPDSSSTSTSRRPISFKISKPNPRFSKPLKCPSLKLLGCSSNESVEDGSAEQFFYNNSIADFMRFKRGSHRGSDELQTAVVGYRKRFPWSILYPFLQVDLVSTFHIADKEESLENRRNPAAAKRLKSSRSRGFNIRGCIQRQMARILMLDFQLVCLDYQADNWYHADLDYETFKLLQLEKSESFFTFARDMTLKSTKALLQPASIPEDLDPWRSKLLWASGVLPMPTCRFTQVTADVEEKSVIIGERNIAAIDALRRAIDDDGHYKIAILYGGGHMPDLGRRLREEFDLVPSLVQWITAWSITKRDFKSSSLPILKTMAEISGWPLNRYHTLALLIFSPVLAIDLWFWELFCGIAVKWISEIASEMVQYVDNAQAM
ncbi:hypothetical protein REPUB_Repub18cG0092600 [Reevesia pubescens]